MAPSRLPTKTWRINLGLAMRDASMNWEIVTVGIVLMAPLDSEYGRGHNLIIIKSFRPSCLRVSARAAKRLSFVVRRST